MSVKGTPKIKDITKDVSFTQVTFKPDLIKFNMVSLDEDIVNLMRKRVYDLAGCLDSKVKVYLNGNKINIKDFKEYCSLYLGSEKDAGAP